MRAPAPIHNQVLRSAARPAFTLIELLVVIAIIAVLSALTTAAVQKVRQVGQRTAVVDDLNKLDMGCSKFKTDFGTNVPSRFRFPTAVPNPPFSTTAQQEEAEGYKLLRAMFRAWPPPAVASAPGTALTPANGVPLIYFRGDAVNGKVIDGSQCLVFFLGGPNGQGFLTTGPYDGGNNTSRKQQYFEFVDNRIDTDTTARKTATDGFAYKGGYKDSYGVPYAFFSAGSSEIYPATTWPDAATTPLAPNYGTIKPFLTQLAASATASAPAKFDKFVNSGKVQIISAGRNKLFGPGGLWVPGGSGYQPDSSDGGDDLANFNTGLQLGVPNN